MALWTDKETQVAAGGDSELEQLENVALAMPKEGGSQRVERPCRERRAGWGSGAIRVGGVCPAGPSLTLPVFLQFFAFLTTLLYILHAFSIYYH